MRGWIFGTDSLKCGIHQSITPFIAMESLLWLLLEAGIALLILIFIVWWTLPRKKSGNGKDGGK